MILDDVACNYDKFHGAESESYGTYPPRSPCLIFEQLV